MGARSPLILALTGATATGKTEAAIALADRLPISIISLDSAMVYRGLDIGTAKPAPEILSRYPHALVDIRDPAEPYSAADFVADADRAVRAALAEGRTPLLVGGTMLYLKAFREGLAPLPQADPAIRADIRRRAAEHGWPALHAELQAVDPVAASGIHPNNAARIERALEVHHHTGLPMSEIWSTAPGQRAERRHQAELKEFAIMPSSRAELHQRIAARVDQMLAGGLVAEVAALHRRQDLHADLPAMRSVGYRQVWDCLEGRIEEAELRERIIVATRQLAKRQLTWLRSFALETVDWGDSAAIARRLQTAAQLEK